MGMLIFVQIKTKKNTILKYNYNVWKRNKDGGTQYCTTNLKTIECLKSFTFKTLKLLDVRDFILLQICWNAVKVY